MIDSTIMPILVLSIKFGIFLRINKMNSTQKTTDEYLANTKVGLCENTRLDYMYSLGLIVPWIGIF